MTRTHITHCRRVAAARRRSRITWIALPVITALIAVGAAATAIGRGSGTEQVSASFATRAIGNPDIKSCPEIRDGSYIQFEANYQGSLTSEAGEEFVFTVRGAEILANAETGLGSAEGTWVLQAPDSGDLVGSGELTAVFVGDPHIIGDPDIIGDPNLFAGDLHGMLIGAFGDPGGRRAIWNFSASLTGDRTRGAIGDPNIAPNPAILIPPGPC